MQLSSMGPKLINGTMIYISSYGRCQKNGSTFISMEKSILGLTRKAYISLWNFNMSRYLLFLVNQVCFLCVAPYYPVCGPLNEFFGRFLKGGIHAYVRIQNIAVRRVFLLSYLFLDPAAGGSFFVFLEETTVARNRETTKLQHSQ